MLLHLVEYGEPVTWTFSNELLEGLRSESQRWKELLGLSRPPFAIEYAGANHHTVRAEAVTGFVRVGELAVEVRPKFLPTYPDDAWRRALWQILVAVEEPSEFGVASPAGTVGERSSFLDLMGEVLLRSLRRGHMEGFPRGYVEHRGTSEVLKGSIDLSASGIVELVTRPYLVPCVYDIYHEDTPVNRLLRWAAVTLSGLVRSPGLANALSDEAAALGMVVGPVPPGLIEAEYAKLPVQYEHLSPALQVARVLMRQESLQHQEGEHQVQSFLWKSSTIFQRFVEHLLYLVCDSHEGWRVSTTGQSLATLKCGRGTKRLSMFPDYRVSVGADVQMVLDAKYKVWTGEPRVEDVYQVMAGGRVNSCNNVFLIYPSSDGVRQSPITWRIKGEGYPMDLTAVFVNLSEMGNFAGEEDLANKLDEDLLHTALDLT